MIKKIIIFTSFVLIMIIGWLITWPQIQELRSLRKEIQVKGEELTKIKDYYADLAQIEKKLKDYPAGDLAKLEAALPNNPSLPALFNYLQKTANINGLTLAEISAVSINPLKDRPRLKEIVFNAELVGSYSSFKNWLSQITSSARLIEVEDINFSSVTKTEKGKTASEFFTFKIRIKVFSY